MVDVEEAIAAAAAVAVEIAEALEEAGAVEVEIAEALEEAGAVEVEIAEAFVVDEEAEGVAEVAVELVLKFESSGMVSACDTANFC